MIKKFTRRQFLQATLWMTAGSLVVACAADETPPAPPAPQAQPTLPAATPTSAPAPATATPQSPVAVVAAPTATVAPAAPVVVPTKPATTDPLAQEIARAAEKFLSSLDTNRRAKATYAFNDKERQRWHWTTPSAFPRNGLPLREMSAEQRTAALALLRASVSEAGYKKSLDIMALQKDLNNDPELYYVSVFGTPGANAPWGWRFEGHHLSRNFTLVGDKVAQMPYFLGAWPTVGTANLRAMPREEDAARELVRSLSGKSRETAVFQAQTLTTHVTQNEAYVKPLEPAGIALTELTSDQQKLALEIIQTYLGVLPTNISATHYERLRRAGFDQVRFGWTGSMEPRRPHYYRLQGPTFLLEHDNSRNGGTHIHSVWRDFSEDFGAHLL